MPSSSPFPHKSKLAPSQSGERSEAVIHRTVDPPHDGQIAPVRNRPPSHCAHLGQDGNIPVGTANAI